MLGQINSIATTPEGGVSVVDGQARHVAEFDAQGGRARTVGGPGTGPGEFVAPAYVGLRSDTLWVTDEGQRRTSYFTSEGEHLRTNGFPTVDLPPPYRLLSPRGPVGISRFAALVSIPAMAGTDVDRLPIVAVTEGGRLADTLGMRRFRHTGFVAQNPDRPWAGFVTRQPFGPITAWEILPSSAGILVADFESGEDPRLVLSAISPTGDTLWSDTHTYRPMPLPLDRLRQARADLTERVLNARGPEAETESEARRLVDEALYVPDFLPTVTDLVMASDADFYVRREEAAPGEPQRWTFFSGREPVADVEVPPGIRIHAAAPDGLLWGVLHDDLDVPYVVRLRVEEP